MFILTTHADNETMVFIVSVGRISGTYGKAQGNQSQSRSTRQHIPGASYYFKIATSAVSRASRSECIANTSETVQTTLEPAFTIIVG